MLRTEKDFDRSFRESLSKLKNNANEAGPGSEKFSDQVQILSKIQQNTIKNMEEHNTALRDQNEVLLQICKMMSSDFRQHCAFYKNLIQQKSDPETVFPILNQLKDIQNIMNNLRIEVRALSIEVGEIKAVTDPKLPNSASAAESNASINIANPVRPTQNNYLGFNGPPQLACPLTAYTGLYGPSLMPVSHSPVAHTPGVFFQNQFIPPPTIFDPSCMPPSPSVNVSHSNSQFKSCGPKFQFAANPLLRGTKSASDNVTSAANDVNGSTDEVEDYEPEVDFIPVVPLPALVEVKTGEEDEEEMFCERAKLFRFDGKCKEWKERGIGTLKLLKNTLLKKVRILMRRDQTHKVCANHFISTEMKLSPMANSDKAWVWAANDFADETVKVENFAVRFKNQDQALLFKTKFEEAQQIIPVESTEVTSSQEHKGSLFERFKPVSGSWECDACLVMNDPSIGVCVACQTAKPGYEETQKPATSTETSKGHSFNPLFSFGINSFDSTTGSYNLQLNKKMDKVLPTLKKNELTEDRSPNLAISVDSVFTNFDNLKLQNIADPQVSIPSNENSSPFSISKTPQSGFGIFGGSANLTTPLKSSCSFSNQILTKDQKDDSSSSDTTIDIVFEKKPSAELIQEAQKLMLPDNFFLYRDAKPCVGCRGCSPKNQIEKSDVPLEAVDNIKVNLFKNVSDTSTSISNKEIASTNLFGVPTNSSCNLFNTKSNVFTSASNIFTSDSVNAFSNVSISKTSTSDSANLLSTESTNQKTSSTLSGTLFNFAPSSKPSEAKGLFNTVSISKIPASSNNLFGATSHASVYPFGVSSKASTIAAGNLSMTSTVSLGTPSTKAVDLFSNVSKVSTAASDTLFGAGSNTSVIPFGVSSKTLTTASNNLFCALPITSTSPANLFSSISNTSTTGSGNLLKTSAPVSSSLHIPANISTPESGFSFGAMPRLSTVTSSSLFGTSSNTTTNGSGNLFGAVQKTSLAASGTSSNVESSTSTTTASVNPFVVSSTSLFSASSKPSSVVLVNSFSDASKISTTMSVNAFVDVSKTPKTASKISAFAPVNHFTGDSGAQINMVNESSKNSVSPGIFSSSSNVSLFGSLNFATGTLNKTTSTDTIITTSNTATNAVPCSNLIVEQQGKASTFGRVGTNDTINGPKLFDVNSSNIGPSGSSITITVNPENSKSSKNENILSVTKDAISFSDVVSADPSFSLRNADNVKSSAWVAKPIFGSKTESKSLNASQNEEEEEHDPQFDPVIPLPDLVEVKTGEEGWEVIFSSRAKTYRFDSVTKQWKERGIGEFKIQYEPNLNKYRLLQRREQVHKLSCNHYLTSEMKLSPMATSEVAWCWMANDFSEKSDGELLKLAVKFKTKELADDFKKAFESCQQRLSASGTSSSVPTGVSTPSSSYGAEATGGASNNHNGKEHHESCSDDDSDYGDPSEMLLDYCILFKKVKKEWICLGEGELRILYDDETYMVRVMFHSTTDKNETKIIDHLISIETKIFPDEPNCVSWSALDDAQEPHVNVRYKAMFDSQESAKALEDTLYEGKDYAFYCDTDQERPEQITQSGLHRQGKAVDNEVDPDRIHFRSCDPNLTSALKDIWKKN